MESELNFEELDSQACRTLLGAGVIGRIAVNGEGGFPLVFPINYTVESGAIVFRTSNNMEHLLEHSIVTFEVDDIDSDTRTGWSVMAHGFIQSLSDVGVLVLEESIPGVGAGPWAPGKRNIWMRVVPQVLSGRRIRYASEQIESMS